MSLAELDCPYKAKAGVAWTIRVRKIRCILQAVLEDDEFIIYSCGIHTLRAVAC